MPKNRQVSAMLNGGFFDCDAMKRDTKDRVWRGANKMPKPGRNDKKVYFLIDDQELSELQRHTRQMAEAFGLDRRIENYQGKKPIGFYKHIQKEYSINFG